MIKPYLVGAALVAFAVAAPAFVNHAQAATSQDPFCKMANGEKNPIAWDEYYHCFGPTARVVHVVSHHRSAPLDPFCKMANGEKNPVAWAEFYHCWNR
jgi:hypothetical protein